MINAVTIQQIYRESRYLLFLTENYVALDILKHYLSDIQHLDLAEQPEEMEPYILFGSSFPKDKEYTQVKFNLVSKRASYLINGLSI